MTRSVRSLVVAFALPLGSVVLSLAPLGCTLPAPESAAAGLDDARAAGLWRWCPEPSYAQEIDEERIWLQFSEDALYCSLTPPSWDTDVTAWTQLAEKAQLRLVPGDVFLPKEAGAHDVTLPVCTRTATSEAPSEVRPGRLLVERSEQLGRTRVSLSYLQTALDSGGAARTSWLRVSGYEDALGAGLLLDGEPWPLPDPDVRMALCGGEDCASGEGGVVFDSCHFDEVRELHELRFDGGSMSFAFGAKKDGNRLRAHLSSASGAIDTFPFAQDSFWHLVGRPTWPSSSARDVAVRFREPVGDVCGILATQLYADSTNGTVELQHCDGGVSTRTVLSHSVELEIADESDAGPSATP